MARAKLIDAADQRLMAHPVEAVYAALADVRAYPRWWPGEFDVSVRHAAAGLVGSQFAVTPAGGHAFNLRVIDVEEPHRVSLVVEGSWLEGEGEWSLRRRASRCLVRYEMSVRSDRWVATLAAKALGLPARHSHLLDGVLEALEAEVARRVAPRPAARRRR